MMYSSTQDYIVWFFLMFVLLCLYSLSDNAEHCVRFLLTKIWRNLPWDDFFFFVIYDMWILLIKERYVNAL